jgi:hypothetical protein
MDLQRSRAWSFFKCKNYADVEAFEQYKYLVVHRWYELRCQGMSPDADWMERSLKEFEEYVSYARCHQLGRASAKASTDPNSDIQNRVTCYLERMISYMESMSKELVHLDNSPEEGIYKAVCSSSQLMNPHFDVSWVAVPCSAEDLDVRDDYMARMVTCSEIEEDAVSARDVNPRADLAALEEQNVNLLADPTEFRGGNRCLDVTPKVDLVTLEKEMDGLDLDSKADLATLDERLRRILLC